MHMLGYMWCQADQYETHSDEDKHIHLQSKWNDLKHDTCCPDKHESCSDSSSSNTSRITVHTNTSTQLAMLKLS